MPADATALSFGLNLAQTGSLVTDDTMTDTTQGQQQAVPELSGVLAD